MTIQKEIENPIEFTGETERFDYSTIVNRPQDISIPHAIELLTNIIPCVFKIDANQKNMRQFNVHLSVLVSNSKEIATLWSIKRNNLNRIRFLKLYPKYNRGLNFLIQHLRNGPCNSTIEEIRKIIGNMCMYQDAYRFYSHKVPITTELFEEDITSLKYEDTRFLNFDGTPIRTNHNVIRGPSSKHFKLTNEMGGCAFGFDDKDELFNMLCASIDNAGINDLKHLQNDYQIHGKLICGGIFSTRFGIFYIDLKLRHNMADAIFPSYSTKFFAWLVNSYTKELAKVLSGENPIIHTNSIYALGHYLNYHKIVKNKIKQLMNASFSKPDFDYVCIECYRPGCNNFNIFNKPLHLVHNDRASCTKCGIAEFCLKCTRASHGGECDKLDEASDEWKRQNTAQCPSCYTHVQKTEGCNHITCKCKAHFCYICNEQYHPNNITEHYAGGPPGERGIYGRWCRGIERRDAIVQPIVANEDAIVQPIVADNGLLHRVLNGVEQRNVIRNELEAVITWLLQNPDEIPEAERAMFLQLLVGEIE